jgi:hypothetical protein
MNRRRTWKADEPNNKLSRFEQTIKRESNRLGFIFYNSARGMEAKGINWIHVELYNISMIGFFFSEIANLIDFKSPTA